MIIKITAGCMGAVIIPAIAIFVFSFLGLVAELISVSADLISEYGIDGAIAVPVIILAIAGFVVGVLMAD
jgi:hypothetical protein